MLARTLLFVTLLLTFAASPPALAAGEVARRAMITAAVNGRATQAALDSLAELARDGDAGVADTLGFVHAVGRGIAKDPPQAFRWYMQAASLGQPEAVVNSVLVWRKMRRAQQDEASRLLEETLTPEAIAGLKEQWAEAVETIQSREDAAKLAKGGKGK